MKTFRIKVTRVQTVYFKVTAETKEAAIDAFGLDIGVEELVDLAETPTDNLLSVEEDVVDVSP